MKDSLKSDNLAGIQKHQTGGFTRLFRSWRCGWIGHMDKWASALLQR